MTIVANRISASLVLFHNSESDVTEAVRSYLASPAAGCMIVVDNSSMPLGYAVLRDPRVDYIHNPANNGFGAAHNLAFGRADPASRYHLIVNPDVSFAPDVLTRLVAVMDADAGIGAAMPKITYPDGTLQPLAKLLPSPAQLFARRFVPFPGLRERLTRTYELHDLPLDTMSDVPNLSGCFLLIRAALLRGIGGFDARYFLYMEDVDLVRRIGDQARTVYVPQVAIAHGYGKGSYQNRRLLKYHLRSAVTYFNRWGWLFDPERRRRNAAILSQLR